MFVLHARDQVTLHKATDEERTLVTMARFLQQTSFVTRKQKVGAMIALAIFAKEQNASDATMHLLSTIAYDLGD